MKIVRLIPSLVAAFLFCALFVTAQFTPPPGAGSGTVTSFSGSGPSWLTWTVSNPTTTPAASLAATTGQSSHQVIGTCGSGTTFAPCSLVAGDLPPVAGVFGSGTITIPAGNSVIVGCTSTCTVPVPVPVANYQICIKNDAGVSTVITLSALGSSAMYPKSDDSGYGTAGTGTMVSSAATGNKVCLIGRDATHYELGAVNATANWTVN